MRSFRLIMVFLFLLSFAPFVSAEEYIIKSIKTGDRFELTSGKTVRLIGIDVPESRPNDRAKVQAEKLGVSMDVINSMGLVALMYIKSLLEGKEILLEFDVEKESYSGSYAAYVYLKVPEGIQSTEYPPGVIVIKEDKQRYFFINALLISLQYARLKTMPPNVKYDTLLYQVERNLTSEGLL